MMTSARYCSEMGVCPDDIAAFERTLRSTSSAATLTLATHTVIRHPRDRDALVFTTNITRGTGDQERPYQPLLIVTPTLDDLMGW